MQAVELARCGAKMYGLNLTDKWRNEKNIFLKKGVAVIFVDNFAGRHVIEYRVGPINHKYQLIHIILMHL